MRRHGDVFTLLHGPGDKTLDANVKTAVGVQRLIPPDRAHWADVHHRADGIGPVPSAPWCRAMGEFVR